MMKVADVPLPTFYVLAQRIHDRIAARLRSRDEQPAGRAGGGGVTAMSVRVVVRPSGV